MSYSSDEDNAAEGVLDVDLTHLNNEPVAASQVGPASASQGGASQVGPASAPQGGALSASARRRNRRRRKAGKEPVVATAPATSAPAPWDKLTPEQEAAERREDNKAKLRAKLKAKRAGRTRSGASAGASADDAATSQLSGILERADAATLDRIARSQGLAGGSGLTSRKLKRRLKNMSSEDLDKALARGTAARG